MINIYDHSETSAQREVIQILCQELGFTYLGSKQGQDNECIIWSALTKYLENELHLTVNQRRAVVDKLTETIRLNNSDKLYAQNREFYRLLEKGVTYPADGDRREGVARLIQFDENKQHMNHFALAEEVSVKRLEHENESVRPDLVLYVNGIAIVVMELKRSAVSVADGIRQNYRNQQQGFIPHFFTTVQLLLAGNKSEGLRYGAIKTPEEFYLRWREPVGTSIPALPPSRFASVENELHRSLLQMLSPERLLEMIRYCIVFDKSVKKIARPNQWFALKAAQQRIATHENGIIWHSQGSGKSLSMVFLARWILNQDDGNRVLIITDRDELDEQIYDKLGDVGQTPYRATSCSNLIDTLNSTDNDLVCTLLHKFGITGHKKDKSDAEKQEWNGLLKEKNITKYLEAIAKELPADYSPKGKLFVFVDECHRTQGGGLNAAMRKIVGDEAMMIGFTGTPLLHGDKPTSREAFGEYIHRYTFREAVYDDVILDLRYEARTIHKEIADEESIDAIFEHDAKGLNDQARKSLMSRWAQIKKIYNSKDALRRVTADILRDMITKQPLQKGYANAMLVAESQPSAYRYWKLFQETELKGHCAVVTSYDGSEPDVSEAFSDESPTEKLEMYNTCKEMRGDLSQADFETDVKKRFVDDPADMKLLIVVDKLLTGFDAPACTYIYIDRSLRDHNLFQAICRTNRKNGEQKDYGFIIDYRDLFENIQNAVKDYTTGAFQNFDREDVEGLLSDTLTKDVQDFEELRKTLKAYEAAVGAPFNEDKFYDYFCYNHGFTHDEAIETEINSKAHLRREFYAVVRKYVRTYSRLHSRMTDAEVGYSAEEAETIFSEVKHYDELRHAIMLRSGDYVDMKRYDARMRDLLDRYVVATRSEKLADFSDFSFLDIVKLTDDGIFIDENVKNELGGTKGVAETMTANVRRVINTKEKSDRKFFENFSTRLNKLIEDLRIQAIEYKDYLVQLLKMVKEMKEEDEKADPRLKTKAQRSLWRLFEGDVELALEVDEIATELCSFGYRNNSVIMRKLRKSINEILPAEYKVDEVISIIENNDYGNK